MACHGSERLPGQFLTYFCIGGEWLYLMSYFQWRKTKPAALLYWYSERLYTWWARICKPFQEPRNRFPAWRAGTTTLFVVPARHAIYAGGIESSKSILSRLQIRDEIQVVVKGSFTWRAIDSGYRLTCWRPTAIGVRLYSICCPCCSATCRSTCSERPAELVLVEESQICLVTIGSERLESLSNYLCREGFIFLPCNN